MRVRSRDLWFDAGFPMRLFRWTPEFSPFTESPLVSVWISLEDLPSHLFAKSVLFNIVECIGTLAIDSASAGITPPNRARVFTEIDISKKLVERIWIALPNNRNYWQHIIYENLPHYCKVCKHKDHLSERCMLSMTEDRGNRGVQGEREDVVFPPQVGEARRRPRRLSTPLLQ